MPESTDLFGVAFCVCLKREERQVRDRKTEALNERVVLTVHF